MPLGIAAARSRRLGAVVLAATGLAQTIPSLALLAILIPVLGIGVLPALVALFVYSLLPIVRNTCVGLQTIPPLLLESAACLPPVRSRAARPHPAPARLPGHPGGHPDQRGHQRRIGHAGGPDRRGRAGEPILTGIQPAGTT